MKKLTEYLAAAGGAIASFFTGLPPLLWILLAVMSLDYVTGLICGLMGKSPKTETGGLSSSAAFQGLLKKILVLIVVGVAALIDHAIATSAGIDMAAVTGACCLWFVASEGLSIVENAAAMGVRVPRVLLQALEIMRTKGGAEEETQHAAAHQPNAQPERPADPAPDPGDDHPSDETALDEGTFDDD